MQPLSKSLSVLCALSLVACAPDLNWREWRTTEVGLSQLFPCKPVRQQRSVRIAGREMTLVLQVCDTAHASWAVAYADTGDPAAVSAVLDAFVASAHANIGAVRRGGQPAAVAGSTPNGSAGRFRIRGQAPDGRAVEEAMLLFARGQQVIQLTALGHSLPGEAVESFFDSVRVQP